MPYTCVRARHARLIELYNAKPYTCTFSYKFESRIIFDTWNVCTSVTVRHIATE